MEKQSAVTYARMPARRGPLTWGQRWVWDIIQELVPHEYRLNLGRLIPVERDCDIIEVKALLAETVARYEVLRTTYHGSVGSEPEQVVLGDGAISLDVREAGTRPPQQVADQLMGELVARHYDMAAAPPLSFGIVTVDDRPRFLIYGMSTMVLDGWSHEVLSKELRRSLGVDVPSVTRSGEGLAPQPLDRAAEERTEPMRRVAKAAYDYWRDQLEVIRGIPSSSGRLVGETPRYHCVLFTSSALERATETVAANAGIPGSAVLLAAWSALLSVHTGQSKVGVLVHMSNRYGPSNRLAMGRYVESTPMCLDLAGPTFADVLADTARRLLRASRHGQYDPADVARLVHPDGAQRGAHLAVRFSFNYLTEPSRSRLPNAPVDASRPAAESTLSWLGTAEEENLELYTQVLRVNGQARIFVWLDTCYLSRPGVEGMLFGMERLLVTAAEGVEILTAQIGTVAGVEPAAQKI
jgi:hypothetical protein